MPAEWHIPRRAKDLAEQQGGFLQNVQTPQLEMLLGAVLEIYATKCLLQILGEAARARLENTPTGTAVPQHVRVVEENFRRVQPSPISEWEQADDSLWGQSLEPLKKQDKMHLNETIRLFSPGGGHEMLHHLGGRSRLVREFKSFRDAPTASHITFRFVRFNAGESVWIRASFEGPPRSPYRGGIFHLLLTLPSAYPLKPPTVRFLTRIYHPNVNPQGDLCMDALQPSNWVPGLTLEFLLISIVGLLSDPDVDDPFVPEIASTYIRDKAEFDRSAEVYTAKYAGSAQKYPIYGVG
jgi:ubiquitin-conjugating enzyme E2 D/E